jgi:hypothetical protein
MSKTIYEDYDMLQSSEHYRLNCLVPKPLKAVMMYYRNRHKMVYTTIPTTQELVTLIMMHGAAGLIKKADELGKEFLTVKEESNESGDK